MMWRSVLLAATLLTFLPRGAVHAQESGWTSGFHLPGLNNAATALGTYDGGLVVAGSFVHAGPARADRIVRWADGSWQPFGEGLQQPARAIQEYGGHLYAGTQGQMFLNGRNYSLARWTGEVWEPVGEGMPGNQPTSVYAMTEFQGSLIVAGWFPRIGHLETKNIARWDGTTWSALSTGIREPEPPLGYSQVYALAEYHGELIAGGRFDQAGGAAAKNLARWDGVNWRPVGTLTVGTVDQLIVHADVLWIRAGTALFRWDGVTMTPAPGLGGPLVVHEGALFTVTTTAIMEWSGSSWLSRGSATTDATLPHHLLSYGGVIVAGGNFTKLAGLPLRRLAAWDEGSWRSFDPSGQGIPMANTFVRALTTYQGELIAGGTFLETEGFVARGIARWDGAAWHKIGSGLSDWVGALTVYNGELIAGGAFAFAGATQVKSLAAWNGTSWRPLGAGLSGLSDVTVLALHVHDGKLYVGGSFSRAGAVDASNVACWDGTTWSALSTGMDDDVYTFATYNNELIAGGSFTQAGFALGPIVRWTGTEWLRLGDGTGPPKVYALAVKDGKIYAAGSTASVFRFGGTSWTTLPALTPHPSGGALVSALTVLGDNIVAGGYFQECIARWTGSVWESLGGGLDGQVFALHVQTNDLYAGGHFSEAGGTPSYEIARWVDSTVPVTLLSLTAAWEDGTATIRWSIAGEPADQAGFALWREQAAGSKIPVIGVLSAVGNSYRAEDPDAPARGCRYWLAEVERGGQVTWHGPITLPPRPRAFRLFQNEPNPFRAETRIAFEIPEASEGELVILDVSGRRQVVLWSGVQPEGRSDVVWNGRDARGARVAAGVYFMHLRAGNRTTTMRLVVFPE